jgi:fructose-specific phosphotransferase system IIC component
MLDRIGEFLEMFLGGLGHILTRLSSEEKSMIGLLLGLLMIAAAMSRVLSHLVR